MKELYLVFVVTCVSSGKKTNLLLIVFLDCMKSNSRFEPSFVEIHQVFRDIHVQLLEHEFEAINFHQTLNLSTNS